MPNFRVAKDGYDAINDDVSKMLIDSNYKTIMLASGASGSVSVPSTPVAGQLYCYDLQLADTLGFVPLTYFYTTQGGQPADQYFFTPTTQPGSFLWGLVPGDPWHYYYPPYLVGTAYTAYTANYMYYVTYLPSQASGSTAFHPLPKSGFISVATLNGDAINDSIENLAWTSAAPTLHVVGTGTYTATASVGAYGDYLFTFAHGMGQAYAFNGFIISFPHFDGNYYNVNMNVAANMASVFSVDATNFYFHFYSGYGDTTNINATIEVNYLKTP